MIHENIFVFLRTGELSNFKFGMDQKTIISILGETSWTIPVSTKDRRHALIKYDIIEFYFNASESQSLYAVQITYSEPGNKNNLNIDYKNLDKPLRYSEIKDLLNKNSISFEEKESDYDRSDNVIETQGNVTFYFDSENKVQKFGRFIKAD